MPKYYQVYNKKSLQAISKANYLKDIIIPQSYIQDNDTIPKILKSAKGTKQQKYYYIQQQQIECSNYISPALLLNAFKKIYPNNNTSKIDSHSFVNTHQIQTNSYFKTTKEFQQLIDIVILEKNNLETSESQTSRRSYITIASSPHLQRSQKQTKDYQAYIVHFSYASEQGQGIKWDTFVQKYGIRNINDQQEQLNYKITYSMIFSYTESSFRSYSFLNFVSSNNATVNFLHKYFDPKKGNEERLKIFQSYVFHLNQLGQEKQKQNDSQHKLPCYSIQYKRQRNIPPQHFMEYKNLKDKMLKSYKRVNQQFIKNGSIKDVDMKVQNMVCRFLIEHNYNFSKVNKQLSELLSWEHQLRKNFKFSDFKYWTDMDIISKIGQDRAGRPVILFKTYNFFADKCPDVSDYINFLFYFIVVQIASKSKGYIDEIILLADCSDNTMRNLKVQVNRRMVPTGLKYCPRMFFRLILVKCTAIPYYAYTLAKPLLPSYSNEIILMAKQGDQRVAFQQCIKWMDIDVIPEVIGGKNTLCKDISQQNLSTRVQQ